MDPETTVLQIIADGQDAGRSFREKRPLFTPVPAAAGADMLDPRAPVQIQRIGHGLSRMGIVGDGNCMIHSILFATSPSYRSRTAPAQSYIADRFREIVNTRDAELRDLADVFFPEIGAAGLEESFEVLREAREEIDLEMGMLVARLTGHNLLAIQLDDALTIRPVALTWIGYDAALPTILINYLGGAVNVGQSGFQSGGHYETIIAAVRARGSSASTSASGHSSQTRKATASGRRKTAKAKKPAPIELNDATRFVFQPGDPALEPILAASAL
jgi:hypothetical protein